MDVNLVLFKNDGSQKSFPLPSSLAVIGRRHDCDLCIPLMRVSRRHCQLDQNNETLKLRDLGSRNGTYLNGELIDGETTVRAGDYLQVGPLVFQLQIDGQPEQTVPPQDAGEKVSPEEPVLIAGADDNEEDFPELEIDDSDSFLDELEAL